MKQKALVISGCIAALATPSVSVADVLPESLVGLNLGEVRSSSFLNEPFKGVIPFLFTSYENSKKLKVRLAPTSIFEKIGAEKHPVLNALNFQITKQDGKPVILISSNQPINLPFLNFVLEIQDSKGVVYQDYTVLLDPSKKSTNDVVGTEYVDVNPQPEPSVFEEFVETEQLGKDAIEYQEYVEPDYDLFKVGLKSNRITKNSNNQSTKFKATASISPKKVMTATSKVLKYRVKTGDSLSKIAQNQNITDASLSTMSSLIFQKNPKAFVRGDKNRIKKGALLNLPTASEVNGFELATKKNKVESNKLANKKVERKITTAAVDKSENTGANTKIISQAKSVDTKNMHAYKVVKGDTLSQITKKFVTKEMSFTKLMNEIHANNPSAFIDNRKSKIRLGAEIKIPSIMSEMSATPKSKTVVAKETNALKEKANNKVGQATEEMTVEAYNETNNETNIEAESKQVESSDVKTSESNIGENQYVIKKGDSLSQIAKAVKHPNVSYTLMLKELHQQNPKAFVDGKINKLAAGAVLTIPPLSYFEKNAVKTKSVVELKEKLDQVASNNSLDSVKDNAAKDLQTQLIDQIAATENSPVSHDLIRRIRELRKELNGAKNNLSSMKRKLSNKELLLNQKDIQLETLNHTLFKLTGDTADLGTKTATAVKASIAATKQAEQADKPRYQPKSKTELAKLKRELLNRQEETKTLLEKTKSNLEKTSETATAIKIDSESNFKEYSVSTILENKANIAYFSTTLIFGLLLLRYRRRLTTYTYSAINYDQPKYYEPSAKENYELKETNINYSDPKEDEKFNKFNLLSKEPEPVIENIPEFEAIVENSIDKDIQLETKQEKEFEPSFEFDTDLLVEKAEAQVTEDVLEKQLEVEPEIEGQEEIVLDATQNTNSIQINPLLIEATDDIFAADAEAKSEALELERCDDLVTELFDESINDNAEWNNIEKVCDDHIEKIKKFDKASLDNLSELVDDPDKFNTIMTDLFDNLDDKFEDELINSKIIDRNKSSDSISANY